MQIKRLHIGDFGIIRNQTLEDIHPGLVVIGGPNRSGKSTFMQILRLLGYGLSSASTLPPANVEYMIEADIRDEKTSTGYHIRLEGLSEPVCVIAGKGDRISISEIFKLDAFTYKNLFTISLDQLTRIPEGVSKNEFDKLQAALLGAGMTDIANIPHLEESFSKLASAIGGTTGRLRNKGFRPHVQFIREGVNKKKKALGQVEEYQKQQTLLLDLNQKEQTMSNELRDNHARRDLLEAVKGNYDMLGELVELEQVLQQHMGTKLSDSLPLKNRSIVEALFESCHDLKAEWEQEYKALADGLQKQEETHSLMELLLEHRIPLQEHYEKLSGLEVRWDHLTDLKWNLEENRQDILERIQRLHRSWSMNDLERIRNLPLEFMEESRLMELVSCFQKLENQLERTDSKLEETQATFEGLEKQREEWENHTPLPGLKLYFLVSVSFILSGSALSFLHLPAGLLAGFLGILGVALLAFYKGMGHKDAQIRSKEIQGRLHSCSAQLDKLHIKRRELAEELAKTEAELIDVSNTLGLEELPSPGSLLEYYRSLMGIQEGIHRLDRQESDISEQSGILAAQFHEIHILISRFENLNCRNYTQEQLSPDIWMEIQNSVEKWQHKLKIAIHMDHLSSDIKRTEARIYQLIGMEEGENSKDAENDKNDLVTLVESYFELCESRSDYLEKINRRAVIWQSLERAAGSKRITQAMITDNILDASLEEPVQVLLKIFNEFPARESIEREYEELVLQIKKQEEELESCRKEIQKTSIFLDQLSLTELLEQAHAMIHKGRSGLYQESYRYAVYKTAAWICREIRNGFLEKTKDELLLQSEDILEQLTAGDYRRILPKEDLSDFSFVLKNGGVQEDSSVLSRGTAEQVFLAIRLGRIIDSGSGLPVIIDDSLVNFDAAHLNRALAVIAQLSKTHQVFLMTCHPHLVDLLMDMDVTAQYWLLNNGRFTPGDGGNLSETLHFSCLSC